MRSREIEARKLSADFLGTFWLVLGLPKRRALCELFIGPDAFRMTAYLTYLLKSRPSAVGQVQALVACLKGLSS